MNNFSLEKTKKILKKLWDKDPVLFDLNQKLGKYLMRHIKSLSVEERKDYNKINKQIHIHINNKNKEITL